MDSAETVEEEFLMDKSELGQGTKQTRGKKKKNVLELVLRQSKEERHTMWPRVPSPKKPETIQSAALKGQVAGSYNRVKDRQREGLTYRARFLLLKKRGEQERIVLEGNCSPREPRIVKTGKKENHYRIFRDAKRSAGLARPQGGS